MGFKLVRIDTSEPQKIPLSAGTHLIGRGSILACEDKRVSRNHGELEVSDDSVTIKALHLNPCFIVKKNDKETQILKLHSTKELHNGDKFGLLPNTYWYELLYCTVPEVEKQTANNMENQQEVDGRNEKKVDDEKQDNGRNEIPNDDSLPIDFDMNETVDNDRPESPSLLPTQNQVPNTEEYKVDEGTVKVPVCDQSKEQISPAKRCHSPALDDEVKKIKVEPDQEPGDVKPGPSNDQGNPSNSDDKTDKADNAPPSPAKPANNGPLRERCMYGANCYRKNSLHKAKFSHPQDPDWGAGDRGVCPWGLGCRRRNVLHWQNNTHPPGAQPPPLPGKKKRGTKKTRNDSDEDSQDQSYLIVTGKRARKTIERTTWSGSESENEDPYQTDSSEAWEPIDTQGTQDTEELYSQDY